MFRKVTIAIISSLICGITQAAPAPKVQDVNIREIGGITTPSMIPVDVKNTVEITAPNVIPVEINGITTPSMIPVDVMNPVEIVGPMYFPQDIRETMISAGGEPLTISEEQVIREIVVLPSPGEPAALGCKLRVELGGIPISHASWNGDEYGSFPLSLVGPIDVAAGTEIKTVLTPLPIVNNGTCSADLVVFGIVMPNI